MNTIELIEDAVAFGGTVPNNRMDEVREFINNLKTKPLNIDNVVCSDATTETIYVSHGNDGDDDVYCAFTDKQRGQRDCNESGTILTSITLHKGKG